MDVISTDDKAEKIDELKDKFATMKWEIWERFSDTGYDTETEWNNEVKKPNEKGLAKTSRIIY